MRTTSRNALFPIGLAAAALLLAACSSDGGHTADSQPTGRPTSVASAATTSPPAGASSSTPAGSTASVPATTAPATSNVHISLLNNDGATYGVGMPVIAYFSRTITDAAPLQRATSVTVDGTPARGAWYFERSGAGHGPIEAHFRLADYWPAHAKIRVDIAAKGLSAGKGLKYDNTLFSEFRTGARTISEVNDAKHTITVTSDGKQIGTYPVSLGAKGSPTERGTKVIMEQGKDIRMQGTSLTGHYNDPHVYWTQRLTYSGEYLHAAPWNDPAVNGGRGNIGSGNSSNGCTNLTTKDAKKLYTLMRIGDVVRFPNADGRQMQLRDGYGDWNLTWSQWVTGGLVPTT